MAIEIEDKILEAYTRHKEKTGKYPTNLYLGSEDFENLLRYATLWSFYQPTSLNNERLKAMGMSAYEVDAKNHLAVS